ncbi:phage portal protein, partial [Desulfobotulus sp. H1]
MTTPLRIPSIRNLDLRHSQPGAVSGGNTFGYSRKGAGRKGSLGRWYGQKLSRFTESREREILTGRAADIIGSDPHAASVSDSMATHIVGTGLTPQPSPFFKALGMSEDEAQDMREACRLAWISWQSEADARGRLPFWMLSLLAVYDYFT